MFSEFTCTECLCDSFCKDYEVQKSVQDTCVQKPETIEFVEMDDQIDIDDSTDGVCNDDDANGQTDVSDTSDVDDDDGDDEFKPGDIVWAKHGRIWYPAQIHSLADLLSHLQSHFSLQRDKLLVKWFGEENYSSVTITQVDILGENLIDAATAKSKFIMEQYNIALGQRLSYIS